MRRIPSALLIAGLALAGLALAAGVQPAHALCPDGSFQCTCNGVESCQTSILGCWSSCESASRPDLAAAPGSATASFLAGLAPTAETPKSAAGRPPGGAACTAEFCDSCAQLLKECRSLGNFCFCAS
jgi:hypothetical protein